MSKGQPVATCPKCGGPAQHIQQDRRRAWILVGGLPVGRIPVGSNSHYLCGECGSLAESDDRYDGWRKAWLLLSGAALASVGLALHWTMAALGGLGMAGVGMWWTLRERAWVQQRRNRPVAAHPECRILLVTADRVEGPLIDRELASYGTVTSVRTAEEACCRIRDQEYDVIVSDVTPSSAVSAYSVDVLVRACAKTPLVLLSGQDEVALAISRVEAGAFDFLEKPIQREAVRDVLERAYAHGKRNKDATAR